MNFKIVIIGIVLITAVLFGFWFWGEFRYNQNELSNMPLDVSSPDTQSDTQAPAVESASGLESELGTVDVEGLDAEEFDLTGL